MRMSYSKHVAKRWYINNLVKHAVERVMKKYTFNKALQIYLLNVSKQATDGSVTERLRLADTNERN